jgi:hypothetical protein
MGEQQESWGDVDRLVLAVQNYRYWRDQHSRIEDSPIVWESVVAAEIAQRLEKAANEVRFAIRAVTTGAPDVSVIPLKFEEETVGRDKADEPVA